MAKVMSSDLSKVREYADISEQEQQLLLSPQRPIVLLRKKHPNPIADSVAPNNKFLGVMLPYTPLHYLLLENDLLALVMTSGNLSEEPIVIDNEYSFQHIGNIADYFLIHNREIIVPVDDAVVKVADEHEILVRCGRGYAPLTISIENKNRVLAFGAEQKCSVCITENGYATVSQYIGDLNEYQTYKVFNKQIEHFKSLFSYCPDIYAYDLHIATSTVVLLTITFQMIVLGLIADLVVSLHKT